MKEKNNLPKENKRKATVLLIFGALVLIVLVAGSTYAYFRAQVGNGTNTNIDGNTGTVDDLRFEKGEDLTFKADMTNFAEGLGNVSGSTTSKAILTANDATNSAKEDYNVYVNIETNEIEYTSYKKDTETKVFKTKEEKERELDTLTDYTPIPELILSITGPDKKIVGSSESLYEIEGLTYYENIETIKKGETEEQNETQTVEGYDITEQTGLIKIVLKEKTNNYSAHIEANAENNTNGKIPYQTTQEWEVKVTFINLNTDQNLNTNKHFSGNVLLQKEEKKTGTTIAEVCKNEEFANCIKENYELDDTIVYHNGTIKSPEVIQDLDDETIISGYKITDEYKDDYIALYASSSSDDLTQKYLIRFKCNDIEQYLDSYCYAEYPQYYYLNYNEGEHYDTFKQALQQAINEKYVEPEVMDANDDSYRYTSYNYEIALEYQNQYDKIPDMLNICGNNYGGGAYFDGYYWKFESLEGGRIYDNCFEGSQSLINYGLSKGYITVKEVSNYICLDQNSNGECSNEDLYRIIGLFKNDKDQYEMKVIKATYATKDQLGENDAHYNCTGEWCMNENYQDIYYWNNSKSYDSTANWRDSDLNTKNLNNYFLNEYLEKHNSNLKNKISDHTWITGGIFSESNSISPLLNINMKEAYELELGKNARKIGDSGCYDSENVERQCIDEDLTYNNAKIGLMYFSDYLYGSFPNSWNIIISNANAIKVANWMGILPIWTPSADSSRVDEWTITRYKNKIYLVGDNSYAEGYYYKYVRPVFYLSSDVKLASGDGSKINPYRLNFE